MKTATEPTCPDHKVPMKPTVLGWICLFQRADAERVRTCGNTVGEGKK